MISFTKEKLRKSDDQTNIEKYRVVGNITKHTTILKLIFQRIIIPKFMIMRQSYLISDKGWGMRV